MPDADQDPRWIKMYEDFIAQTEPAEMSKQLEPLETAIAERRKELTGATDANQELHSIEEAMEKVLQIKNREARLPPDTQPC